MTQLSGRSYIFCGKLSDWNYNDGAKSFEIPIDQLPYNARYIQMINVEFKGLEPVPGPFILLLRHCIMSGVFNDQQCPIIYFSGLSKNNKCGPIARLSISTQVTNSLYFTLQLVDYYSTTPITDFKNITIAFELRFFN